MRYALGRFCELLRRDGMRVSAAELLDAGRAMTSIDVADREQLRDTLTVTLAKSRADQETLTRAFDRFFVAPAIGGRRRRRRRKRRAGGAPDWTGRTGGQEAPGASPRDAASVVRAARRRMLEATPRSRRTANDPRQRYPTKILAPRTEERARAAGERPRSLEAAFEAREREGRGRRTHRAPERAAATEAAHAARRAALVTPFRSRWSTDERRALAELLERRLRRMHVARRRRKCRARRGALWVQRVVRANLGHDGIPFRIVRHAPSRREPRVVLLVDVSHSVARAASAFFALATHLTRSLRSVRAFAFVDDVADVTPDLPRLATLRGETAPLETVIGAHERLDPAARSDYGRVLYRLLDAHRVALCHDAVLIVLGDARTNRFDPATWVLEEIRARVKRIVWLVPEPLSEWDTGDSVIAAYAPRLDLIAEASDLLGLEGALARVLPRR